MVGTAAVLAAAVLAAESAGAQRAATVPAAVAAVPGAVPLWPAAAPGAVGDSAVDRPTVTPFLAPADRATGAAMLVFPGGGYDHLAVDKEGVQVARWLNALGVSAFVVQYRLGPRYRHPAMEQDALRAVRLVRARAAEWGVDARRVGVVGFSAGGHLAATAATRWRAGDARSADAVERQTARPDAMLLAYPVVTLADPLAHRRSRANLLGDRPDPALVRALSLETQVRASTPPAFVVASSDDASVPVGNALLLYQALRQAGVPAELHVYERGRHGFGLAASDPVLSGWTTQAAAWLRARGFAAPDAGVAPTVTDTTAPAAVVDARHAGQEGATVAGARTYRTLNAALADAPGANDRPWLIRVRPGRYREKISVDKPNVWIVGAGRDSTVLTWDDAAGTPRRGGGTLGTRDSWTMRVINSDVRLARLTVENAFDYPGNARKPDTDPTKIAGTQGVALSLTERADRTVLDDVRLSGHQDTFFAQAGRTYVRGGEVRGNVDFIFGAGRVVFDSVDVISLDRGDPRNNGIVVAPSTDLAQPYGFLFVRSRLRKERPAMAAGSVMLGRPWHPSADPRAVGSAVFVDTWMDDHVTAQGWDRMSSTHAATGQRLWFEPSAARFFEVGSTGPGAIASPTRRVLGEGDARTYTVPLVLDGWMPAVGGAR
jgi:pectinesterase